MPIWRLSLFGSLRVEGPEFAVDRFETRRAALLLARLALSRGNRATRETLADELWPDDFFDATRVRLRQELSRLRKALGPAQEMLWADASSVGLEMSQVTIDVHEFVTAVRQANLAPTTAERAERLRDALKTAGSPMLPGWDEPWVVGERARIDAARLEALIEVADYLTDNVEHAEALTFAEQALIIDPGVERAHMVAMRGHAGLGSLADALAQFQRMKRILKERQATEPSPQAIELAGRLGRGEVEAPVAPAAILPTPIDRLFGREAELRSLSLALEPGSSGRLLTLLGPGGMGKTRLSLEVAHALREAYQGRIYFVPLADISDADAIESHTVEAVAATAKGTSPFEAIALTLGERPSLLILDNLEHLIRPSAAFAERLLQRIPSLRILTTSRQALGIAGEREVPLAPLSTEAGIEFFAARAQAVRPGFTVNARNEESLRGVVERLEGLPLAIYLAASRSHLLTPEQMLHQLQSRLAFLVGRGGEGRHRTMRATIAWSDDLLEKEPKRMLRKLAIFRGGWTLASAIEICEEPNALDLLGELHDRSLIFSEETEDGMRYRMLEAIREFGLENLPPEDEADLHRRHAEYFCGFAETTHREHYRGRNVWQRLIAADLDNIRDALHWTERHDPYLGASTMATLWNFWNVRGLLSEGRAWARSLMSDLTKLPATHYLGTALAGAGLMAAFQEDHSDAVAWFERAREIMRPQEQVGHVVSVQGFITANMAESLLALGDMDAALEAARQGLDFWQRSGSNEMIIGLNILAGVHVGRKEFDEAEPLLRESLRRFQERGDTWGIGDSNYHLAAMHWAKGEPERAREHLIEAEQIFEAIGELSHLSLVCLLRAKVEGGQDPFAQKAIEIAERVGAIDRQMEVVALRCRATGDWRAAAEYLDRIRHAASSRVVDLLIEAIAEKADAEFASEFHRVRAVPGFAGLAELLARI